MSALTTAEIIAIVERVAAAKTHPAYDSAAQAYVIDVPRLVGHINERDARIAALERVVEEARVHVGLADADGLKPSKSFRRGTHTRMMHTSAAGTPLACRLCDAIAALDSQNTALSGQPANYEDNDGR